MTGRATLVAVVTVGGRADEIQMASAAARLAR
jgi:hypothetical protein